MSFFVDVFLVFFWSTFFLVWITHYQGSPARDQGSPLGHGLWPIKNSRLHIRTPTSCHSQMTNYYHNYDKKKKKKLLSQRWSWHWQGNRWPKIKKTGQSNTDHKCTYEKIENHGMGQNQKHREIRSSNNPRNRDP